jgi:hypothetical protein
MIQLGLAGLLVFALREGNPYGFYQLLRWLCFGVFAYSAYSFYEKQRTGWTWSFLLLALLYNPFAKVALGRQTWEVVNVASAVVLAVAVWIQWRGSRLPRTGTDS